MFKHLNIIQCGSKYNFEVFNIRIILKRLFFNLNLFKKKRCLIIIKKTIFTHNNYDYLIIISKNC